MLANLPSDAVLTEKFVLPGSTLERMPKWLRCIPLTLQWLLLLLWLWLALRYQSLSLPTIANPAITAGGLVGEGKLEYFDVMGPIALSSTAAYCSTSTHKRYSGADLRQLMRHANLSFPVIAKPDLGLCGYGVRLLANRWELRD